MHDKNDKISCGCGNKFTVFETAKCWRLMSCTLCRRIWWIKCSGRRLVEYRKGDRNINVVNDERQETIILSD